MPKVKFLKDPGYLYDLFFLFVLRFNKEQCMKNYVNKSAIEEDTVYYQKLYDEVKEIPEDILPFFYLKDGNKCFMTLYYLEKYMSVTFEQCSVDSVRDSLEDCARIIENMICFYFPGVEGEKLELCKRSFVEISRLINKSDYSAEVKSSLYGFFLEPEHLIQKLSYELASVKQYLSQLYERKMETILSLYQNFNVDKVILALSTCRERQANFESYDEIYVSFCLCAKNSIKMYHCADTVLLFLGESHEKHLTTILDQKKRPALDAFGNVLSEPNRVDILDFLATKKEATIREIEETLEILGTNAYYHLSLMVRIGLVKIRNRGRTLLYSLNREYFDSVCGALQRYGQTK